MNEDEIISLRIENEKLKLRLSVVINNPDVKFCYSLDDIVNNLNNEL